MIPSQAESAVRIRPRRTLSSCVRARVAGSEGSAAGPSSFEHDKRDSDASDAVNTNNKKGIRRLRREERNRERRTEEVPNSPPPFAKCLKFKYIRRWRNEGVQNNVATKIYKFYDLTIYNLQFFSFRHKNASPLVTERRYEGLCEYGRVRCHYSKVMPVSPSTVTVFRMMLSLPRVISSCISY